MKGALSEEIRHFFTNNQFVSNLYAVQVAYISYFQYSTFLAKNIETKNLKTKIKLEANNPFKKLTCRNSRSQMFFKIGVHKSFAIFTGKHLFRM